MQSWIQLTKSFGSDLQHLQHPKQQLHLMMNGRCRQAKIKVQINTEACLLNMPLWYPAVKIVVVSFAQAHWCEHFKCDLLVHRSFLKLILIYECVDISLHRYNRNFQESKTLFQSGQTEKKRKEF